MLKTTEKFIAEVNELKTLVMKEAAEGMFSDYTDISEIVLCRKLFSLFNSSMDLLEEQARTIDSINDKLDELLKKTES